MCDVRYGHVVYTPPTLHTHPTPQKKSENVQMVSVRPFLTGRVILFNVWSPGHDSQPARDRSTSVELNIIKLANMRPTFWTVQKLERFVDNIIN